MSKRGRQSASEVAQAKVAQADQSPDRYTRAHSQGWPHYASHNGNCICLNLCCFGSSGCQCRSCAGIGHSNCPAAQLRQKALA